MVALDFLCPTTSASHVDEIMEVATAEFFDFLVSKLSGPTLAALFTFSG